MRLDVWKILKWTTPNENTIISRSWVKKFWISVLLSLRIQSKGSQRIFAISFGCGGRKWYSSLPHFSSMLWRNSDAMSSCVIVTNHPFKKELIAESICHKSYWWEKGNCSQNAAEINESWNLWHLQTGISGERWDAFWQSCMKIKKTAWTKAAGLIIWDLLMIHYPRSYHVSWRRN